MYADAMRALSTWNDERGYEPATRAFRRVAALARDGGDAHLECEATLIVAEIEINALRRMYAVMESGDVEESIDTSQFERITSKTLRLAVENGDRISEARAHVVDRLPGAEVHRAEQPPVHELGPQLDLHCGR